MGFSNVFLTLPTLLLSVLFQTNQILGVSVKGEEKLALSSHGLCMKLF